MPSLPPMPIVGLIESPTALDGPYLGRQLSVSGWAVHPSGIAGVSVHCEGTESVTALGGIRRPEVAAAFPETSGALNAGFVGVLDVSWLSAGRHQVKVTAVAGDGTQHAWTVPVDLENPALAYRRWLARNEPPVGAPLQIQRLRLLPQAGPKLGVIIVTTGDDDALARSCAALERQTYRHHATLVCAPGQLAQTLDKAEGDFLSVITAGDTYVDFAFGVVAGTAAQASRIDLLYADHDECVAGRRVAPHFKPAWSPRLLATHDYIGRCWFARRMLLLAHAAEHSSAAGLAHHRLLQDIGAQARVVTHLPSVLLTQAGPAPEAPGSRTAPPTVRADESAARSGRARVSVVIPTRASDPGLLTQCLDGLHGCTEGVDLEVIVLPNNVSDWDATERLLRRWPVRIVRWEGRFNWSGINNLGASEATSDLLLFMNDDVVPLEANWLQSMVALAADPDVGAVGAMLYYPNGQLQHGGVWLPWTKGFDGRHAFRFCTGRESGLGAWLTADREQSAVTGACLLSRRECFDAIGGFDEDLALVFNDVDYCLRLRSLGWSSVMSGRAKLTHHEGISRAGMSEAADARLFMDRWQGSLPEVDPYSNPNLDPRRDDWTIWPDAATSMSARHIANPTPRMLHPPSPRP